MLPAVGSVDWGEEGEVGAHKGLGDFAFPSPEGPAQASE